ncbi:MAG: BapA prefix-like domain-containing protein [Candidatus Acinetobacter avistercoris]|nr:BapA prefix-like domain-containing protein [Candidatus Acinetobacter avistercoris]
MANFIVIEKDSLNKKLLSNENIVLNEASIIHAKLQRGDVAEFIQNGNNLVLKLKNGEVIIIENFFVKNKDGIQSDLAFEDDDCGFLWFELKDGVTTFKEISGLEELLPIATDGSIGILPWIIGGVIGGGVIAAIIDDKDKKDDIKPVPPEAPIVTIDSVNPIVDPKEGSTTTLTGKITPPAGSIPDTVTVTVSGLAPFKAVIDPIPNADGSYNWSVANVPVQLTAGNTPVEVVGTAKDPKSPANISEPSIAAKGNIPVEITPDAPTVTIDSVNPIVDPQEGYTTTLKGKITPPAGSIPDTVTVTVSGLAPFKAVINPTPNADGSYNWSVANVPVQLTAGNTPVEVVGTAKDPKAPANISEPSVPAKGNIPVEITPDLTVDDMKVVNEDESASGNVLENDKKDGLTVTGITINGTEYGVGTDIIITGVGTVNVNANGAYIFSPVKDYSGNVPAITYTVSDGVAKDTANLNIEVIAVSDEPTTGNFLLDPAALSLNIQTWSNVQNVNGQDLLQNGGDGASKEVLLNAIDYLRNNTNVTNSNGSAVGTSGTGVTNSLANTDLPTYEAVYISGYVFLEEGQTYQYTGQGDDSAAIMIGDNVSSLHVNWRGTSTTGDAAFNVSQSGFYTFQFYAHNAAGEGNYNFTLQNSDGSEMKYYPSVSAIEESLRDASYILGQYDAGVDGKNDTGFYPANLGYQGESSKEIDLNRIHLKATDTDGSEYLSFEISGLPIGAELKLKDANNVDRTVTVGANGKATYIPVDLNAGTTEYKEFKLTLGDKQKALLDVSLSVTSTEKSNGDRSSSTLDFEIKLTDADAVVVQSDLSVQTPSDHGSNDVSIIFELLSDNSTGGNDLQTNDQFEVGNSNHIIDVSALLSNEVSNEVSDEINASNLAEFMTVDYDAENDQAIISIDRDGSAGQYQSENLIILTNQPNAFSLDSLLNSNQIIMG